MNNRFVSSISFLVLISISFLVCFFGCSYKVDPGYEIFMVRFTNNSTSTIKNINLQMNSSDDTIKIADLSIGQTAEYQPFVLPDPEGQVGKSWGDYSGVYTQKDTQYTIYIENYRHKFIPQITIIITNSTYTFVSP